MATPRMFMFSPGDCEPECVEGNGGCPDGDPAEWYYSAGWCGNFFDITAAWVSPGHWESVAPVAGPCGGNFTLTVDWIGSFNAVEAVLTNVDTAESLTYAISSDHPTPCQTGASSAGAPPYLLGGASGGAPVTFAWCGTCDDDYYAAEGVSNLFASATKVEGTTPCCGCDCDLFTDRFERAAGPLGADWTADDFTISLAGWGGNSYATTSTSDAIAISPISRTDFTIAVTTSHDGQPRLLCAIVDEDNYYFGEYHAGMLTVGQVSGGVRTDLVSEPASVTGAGFRLQLCNSAQGLTATIPSYIPGNGGIKATAPALTTGGFLGFGVGTVSGTPYFDDFIVSDGGAACEDCVPSDDSRYVPGCEACVDVGFGDEEIEKAAARYMQLDMSGIINGESCSDCPDVLNGTFILQISLPHGVVDCSWYSPVVATNCAGAGDASLNWHYTMQISKTGTDSIRYDVRLWQTDTLTLRGHWSLTVPAAWPLECGGVDGVELPVVMFEDPAALCFLGDSTATISSL